MSFRERAQALVARALAAGQKLTQADPEALARLNDELGGRIPDWFVTLVTTVPLCGLELAHEDKQFFWLDEKGMRLESLGTTLRTQVLEGGYFAIGADPLYYDPYFLKSPCSAEGPSRDDPWVYQITHDDGEVGAVCSFSELLTLWQPHLEPVPPPPPPRPPDPVVLHAGKQLHTGFRGSGYDAMRELGEKLPPDLPRPVVRPDPALEDYSYELRIEGRNVAQGRLTDFNFRKLRDHLRKALLEQAPTLRLKAEGTALVLGPGFAAEELRDLKLEVREQPQLAAGQFLICRDGSWRHLGQVQPGRTLEFGTSLQGSAEVTFREQPARWLQPWDDHEEAPGRSLLTAEAMVREAVAAVLSV